MSLNRSCKRLARATNGMASQKNEAATRTSSCASNGLPSQQPDRPQLVSRTPRTPWLSPGERRAPPIALPHPSASGSGSKVQKVDKLLGIMWVNRFPSPGRSLLPPVITLFSVQCGGSTRIKEQATANVVNLTGKLDRVGVLDQVFGMLGFRKAALVGLLDADDGGLRNDELLDVILRVGDAHPFPLLHFKGVRSLGKSRQPGRATPCLSAFCRGASPVHSGLVGPLDKKSIRPVSSKFRFRNHEPVLVAWKPD